MNFTEQAVDFITSEGFAIFHSVREYVDYLLNETNVNDAFIMVKILNEKIDDLVYADDEFTIIGNTENAFVEGELYRFFDYRDFDGDWEEDDE